MAELTHFDDQGRSRMVDVGGKPPTARRAVASAQVLMRPETMQRIQRRELGKGDVLEVARLAGIMAAKRTGELIPLCHPLGLDSAELHFQFLDERRILISAEVRVTARTGVEMEALVAASTAALTIYDMCKAIDRSMVIQTIQLEEKAGGQSGHFVRRNLDTGEVSGAAVVGQPAGSLARATDVGKETGDEPNCE